MKFDATEFAQRKNSFKGFKFAAKRGETVHKFVSQPSAGCSGCSFDTGEFSSLCGPAPCSGPQTNNVALIWVPRKAKVPA